MKVTFWQSLLTATLFFLVTSCSPYEQDSYFVEEHQAIQDIIPFITDMDQMLVNDTESGQRAALYIIDYLHTSIELRSDINRKVHEGNGRTSYIEEEINFSPFLEKDISSRKLSSPFQNKEVEINIITLEELQNTYEHKLFHPVVGQQKVFGVLILSRIAFNENMDIGYLSYSFTCGKDCAWSQNIEITKVGEQWYISKIYA
ncbi:hypothetical protein [Algivirga pacifica]|uniref:Lipoprotein n=1 Tax=Algivirga pacifica TaxID=1162670 RepID=A0ABP9DHM2_9BACT